MQLRAALLLIFAGSSGCGGPAGDLTVVFGSWPAVDTVKNASSVRAFRLRSPSGHHESLADYAMIGDPVDVSEAAASRLRDLLLDRTAYEWEETKSCLPDYGVRIQFQHEGDDIDVLLCFECATLAVYHNGKYAGGGNFDDISSELAAIIKELFPTDAAIQAID
jgi:hypothetical protein